MCVTCLSEEIKLRILLSFCRTLKIDVNKREGTVNLLYNHFCSLHNP